MAARAALYGAVGCCNMKMRQHYQHVRNQADMLSMPYEDVIRIREPVAAGNMFTSNIPTTPSADTALRRQRVIMGQQQR
jgi:hypothetical protein